MSTATQQWKADSDHRIVWATGADASRFLHDLLSQDIAGLAAGAAARCLLLAPNGRLRAVMTVARHGDAIALISEQSEAVLTDLLRFRIRVDVELESDARSATAVLGSRPGFMAGSEVVSTNGAIAVSDPWRPDRTLVFGDLPALTELPAAPPEQLEAWRIEAGEPRMGVDIGESTVPNEAFDLTTAVDFSKGCYLGQELVERIDARGRIVKRLAGVAFAESAQPVAPVDLALNGDPIGRVTSVAWSDRLGTHIGLGLIKSTAASGQQVEASWEGGGAVGHVRPLPFLTDF